MTWDFTQVKRQLARCSLDFFFAHEDTPENAKLQGEIGADAAILSQKELEDLAVECFQEFSNT